MASVFEKPNFALSSGRTLCACVALFCIEAKLEFPFKSCSTEFRRIKANYRYQFITDVPSVEDVSTDVYIERGFESAIQRNAFMAEMREQEFTPGTYTISMDVNFIEVLM